MNKLFQILDGIVSDKEFCSENLANTKSIINYAESMGFDIAESDAQLIQEVGSKWLDEIQNGNGEWGRMRDDAFDSLDI